MPCAAIPDVLDGLRRGGMVVLCDDENRENEGDLVIAAEKVTPEAITFMAVHGRGLICLALTEERADQVGLPPMTPVNTSRYGTAFTVSIDSAVGIDTGISAADRARTIQVAVADDVRPEDLARPGHVFPIRAREGGVLVRAGQTEGAVDLARLAGLKPAGVICEIMKPDGTMARVPDLTTFCREHDLKMCSVAQTIEFRRASEHLVRKVAQARLPTRHGEFDLHVYEAQVDPYPHVALTLGGIGVAGADGRVSVQDDPVLVRMHSECLTGDVFGSLACDCGQQLDVAMARVAREGRGAIVYMRQEGRGIGLVNKILAYRLQQEEGLDTVEANERLGFEPDLREYGIGAQIMVDLGIRKVRLMTNNPRKVVALRGYGIAIVERVPLVVEPNELNARYLDTKRRKMGHMLDGPSE
ncbi:MAG TPA: bifunctional 3,4-dihydroxy-2-butanone-4-phosphate synthase/GTP cyclohydrolase II [Phycisphaerae bacterium]|nr:bifunctional 3,4-dihydroxy-2-butanone-4-phosphate synthase/GTP cyclohydrolase II [Phycisphaerae bacterium]